MSPALQPPAKLGTNIRFMVAFCNTPYADDTLLCMSSFKTHKLGIFHLPVGMMFMSVPACVFGLTPWCVSAV